ncbi:MAG: DUF3127 domain-containing protein [Phycisphaerales bacterium]|nr:DUF3127 domain-containing protein [Phycisphaerales bacterium]
MQLTAKLIQVLTMQTGTGKNGTWKKQDIIVETDDKYPKKICVAIWGDKINDSQLQLGNTLKIDFDIESREYNSKWYSDVKAWKIEVVGGIVLKTTNGGATNNVNNIVGTDTKTNTEDSNNDAPNFLKDTDSDLPF